VFGSLIYSWAITQKENIMETRGVNFRIPEQLLARIDERAKKQGKNRTEYVMCLVENDLGEHAPAISFWMDLQVMQSAGLIRWGEVEWHELECMACQQPIDKPMIPVMGDGTWLVENVHCSECGFSE
jgi:hypothetical protein